MMRAARPIVSTSGFIVAASTWLSQLAEVGVK